MQKTESKIIKNQHGLNPSQKQQAQYQRFKSKQLPKKPTTQKMLQELLLQPIIKVKKSINHKPLKNQKQQQKSKLLSIQTITIKQQQQIKIQSDQKVEKEQQNLISPPKRQIKKLTRKSQYVSILPQQQQQEIQATNYKTSDVKLYKIINSKNYDIINLDLKLKSRSEARLSQQSILMLAKAQPQMPKLQSIELCNNKIGDKGIKILCQKCEFKNLSSIGLDNNEITLRGLNPILKNSWNQKLQYKLFAVRSDQQELYVHIEDHIKQIKQIYKAGDKILEIMDKLEEQQKQAYSIRLKLLLNIPEEKQREISEDQDSKNIKQQLILQSQANPISSSTVLLQLQKIFGQNTLSLAKKSSYKTIISSKLIFTNFINMTPVYQERYEESSDLFYFSDFQRDTQCLKQFQIWFKKDISQKYNLSPNDITIQKIKKGSILTNYTSKIEIFKKPIEDNYFNNLKLSIEDFDSLGDYQFPSVQKAEVQSRGGLPYLQPVLGKRFGINSKLYKDPGRQGKWIKMDHNKYEWAVGFHGVNNPLSSNSQSKGKPVLQSIFAGRKNQQMLKKGARQAYKGDDCLNINPHNNSKIGEGIYCTPHFLQSLKDYSVINTSNKDDKFHVILQCRLNPKSIKISKLKPQYWVVNESKNIRPYGIILFTNQQKQALIPKTTLQLYKEQFSIDNWNKKYKQKYEQFISLSQ